MVRCRAAGRSASLICLVGELGADDLAASCLLPLQPLAGVAAGPVHARRAAQGVAAGQRVWDPGQAGNGQAGADCVAGTQEGAEVGAVQRPQWCCDDVIPARVAAGPSGPFDLCPGADPDRGAGHRSGRRRGRKMSERAVFICGGCLRRTWAITSGTWKTAIVTNDAAGWKGRVVITAWNPTGASRSRLRRSWIAWLMSGPSRPGTRMGHRCVRYLASAPGRAAGRDGGPAEAGLPDRERGRPAGMRSRGGAGWRARPGPG
jgi:hypothetical protein